MPKRLMAGIVVLGAVFVILARAGAAASQTGCDFAVFSADDYARLAAVYARLGDYVQAAVDYTCVIRLEPDNAMAFYQRGEAYDKLRVWFAALADRHLRRPRRLIRHPFGSITACLA